MPLKVAFELSDKDLKYFRRRLREVWSEGKARTEAEIIEAASELLETTRESEAPEFVKERMGQLGEMISMLEDDEWKLGEPERGNVLKAMAYFAEPQDLIPDTIPGIGFLDDAIMVELVCIELQHELDAFRDFCKYRTTEEKRRKDDSHATREEWLATRRKQLQARMRRRRRGRRRTRGGSGSTGKGPLSLF
jgi:uncharacterized membrane protein YkvA (DUF1232 family)